MQYQGDKWRNDDITLVSCENVIRPAVLVVCQVPVQCVLLELSGKRTAVQPVSEGARYLISVRFSAF